MIEAAKLPELVFGLVGPIGVDMDMVQTQLMNALRSVNYDPISIRVTELMNQIAIDSAIQESSDPLKHYRVELNMRTMLGKSARMTPHLLLWRF